MRSGDRLGVYFQEKPGAIAYKFDAERPMALGKTFGSDAPTQVNETLTFDRLNFPYDFSCAAYIHTDLAHYAEETGDLVPCPVGLVVPDYTPIQAPAPVGEKGEQGPAGPAASSSFSSA